MTDARMRQAWYCLLALIGLAATPLCSADAGPDVEPPAAGPDSSSPTLIGAQYTVIVQQQRHLHAPYSGALSLDPTGDTQPTHTIGLYFGWAPVAWGQYYLDVEKFMGAGVSQATGLGGLTNGDVVREGAVGLKKQFYIARNFVRFMLPLGPETVRVDRAQDQIAGNETTTRLEMKAGRMAVLDDFDQNRYASSPRTQFLNWSLWANTAYDYAANTRGYSDGAVLGYISPRWSIKYGIYRMPVQANDQTLESSLGDASGQNLELRLLRPASGTVVRLLAYLNTARMGNYREALAIAMASNTVPDIAADDREGRRKHGFGLNVEQPLADDGNTGLFLRWGWNDGQTESFAFTEVDRAVSLGGQLAGRHWRRPNDRWGLALVSDGLSGPHRDYLAAGGSGFLLGDGRLTYSHEQILETYYQLQLRGPEQAGRVRWLIDPDFQYIRHPGYNRDRGPVQVWSLRLHLEY
jgi:high affinity Mn2+ porin